MRLVTGPAVGSQSTRACRPPLNAVNPRVTGMTTITPTSYGLRTGAGILGIVAVLAIIPAYIVGSPEAPASSTAAATYFEQASLFVTLNGTLPMLYLLAFLLFLGSFAAVLKQEAPDAVAAKTTIMAGGVTWVTLSAAGWAAEIVYPATMIRFPDAGLGEEFGLVFLTLAVWLYHSCQIGAAVMIIGVSQLAQRGLVFPRWFAYVSLFVAVIAVLHTWIGIWSALASLAWVLLAAILLVIGRRAGPVAP